MLRKLSVARQLRLPLKRNLRPFTVGGNHKGNEAKSQVSGGWSLVKEQAKGALIGGYDMMKNPAQTYQMVKDTIHHYWIGSKLLWTEIKLTSQILGRVAGGSSMTRRERMQLIRTTTDLFRLIPFAIFVIVPFMEFLLPFALKLFPNMLPSTFQVAFLCRHLVSCILVILTLLRMI